MFAARAVTNLRCLTKPSLARQLPQLSFATSSVRPSSGDHVKMWSAERVVSLAQVPACIVPFILTTPLTDAMFCTLAVLHSHWGVEAIVVDYIRPSLFNGSTVIPNIAVGLVWALSAVTLGALLYFNYTDVGIVNAIKMLWRLYIIMGIPKKDPQASSHYLVQAAKAFGESLLSIPMALKDVPNLPKGKLLKLTGFFFCGSLAVYYIMGPYQKIKYIRHYNKGEELYRIHGQQAVSSTGLGNEKPFSQSYGLDYREKIDASKSSSDETEKTD